MTMQPIGLIYPDAELILCDLLHEAKAASHAGAILTTAYVGNLKPDNLGNAVIVRRDGGTAADFIDYPRMSVQVYSDNAADASQLARTVRAVIDAAPGFGGIVRVQDMNGPYTVEDPAQFLEYMTFTMLVHSSEGEAVPVVIPANTSGPTAPTTTVDVDSYLHTQTLGSYIWVIHHNLGFMPAGIRVLASDGSVHHPKSVTHTDANSLTLTFGQSITGTAHMS